MTEAAFLSAAAQVFGERGFDASTTKTIATAAGYSEALINTYFGGKEGLFHAVLKNGGQADDAQTVFFSRPFPSDLQTEIAETLIFLTANITKRSDNMRIVMARVLVDQVFRESFNINTSRLGLKREIECRMRFYRNKGALRPDIDTGDAAEFIIGLCFQVGFIDTRVFSISDTERTARISAFSKLAVRALTP